MPISQMGKVVLRGSEYLDKDVDVFNSRREMKIQVCLISKAVFPPPRTSDVSSHTIKLSAIVWQEGP